MRQRGATLIELLIALALMTVLVIVVAEVIEIYIRTREEIAATTEVNHNLRQAMGRIEKEVKSSNAIVAPATGSTAATLSLNDSRSFELSSNKLIFNNPGSETITSAKVAVTSFTATTLQNGTRKSVIVKLRIKSASEAAYEKELEGVYVLEN